jgi:hypothetical protein
VRAAVPVRRVVAARSLSVAAERALVAYSDLSGTLDALRGGTDVVGRHKVRFVAARVVRDVTADGTQKLTRRATRTRLRLRGPGVPPARLTLRSAAGRRALPARSPVGAWLCNSQPPTSGWLIPRRWRTVEDFGAARSKSAVLTRIGDRKGPASMDADLDLLLTTVYVTANDLLPERQNNAARSVMTRRVVTLCVAQAIMGIPCDRGFGGRGQAPGHLFPRLSKQPGYFKPGRRLADTLDSAAITLNHQLGHNPCALVNYCA